MGPTAPSFGASVSHGVVFTGNEVTKTQGNKAQSWTSLLRDHARFEEGAEENKNPQVWDVAQHQLRVVFKSLKENAIEIRI